MNYPTCKYRVNGKKCFGVVLYSNWKGFCVEHTLPRNRNKFQQAFRVIKKGWLEKWHDISTRPKCKQLVYSGADQKRCSYMIHPGFDDGYCYLHGPT